MRDYRLKAINPEKGIYRWYEIKCNRDLFGSWSLILSFGRISQKGKTKLMLFDSFAEMDKYLQKILRKRLTSHTRIGCNYILVD